MSTPPRGGPAATAAGLALVCLAGPAVAQQGGAVQGVAGDELERTWSQVVGDAPVDGQVAAERARADGAHDHGVAPAVQPDTRGAGWHFDLRLEGRQWARTGLDGANGQVERRTYGLGATATRRGASGVWRLDYLLGSHEYRFDDATGLLPGTDAPVESLVSHRLSLLHSRGLGEHLRGTFIAGLEAAMEDGAAIDDALTWWSVGLVGWQAREDLTLEFGVFARDRLEEDVLVVPALGLDWRITPATQLRWYGPRAVFAHRYDDGAEFFVRGEWSTDQFRLDDSGPNPEGSFSDSGFTFVAGMRFDAGIGEGVLATSQLEVYAGASFARELEFRIGDVEVGSADVDDGAVFGLNYSFGL